MFSDPVIYDEVEKAVYEELWSQARMLTDSEFKSIKRSVFFTNHSCVHSPTDQSH